MTMGIYAYGWHACTWCADGHGHGYMGAWGWGWVGLTRNINSCARWV